MAQRPGGPCRKSLIIRDLQVSNHLIESLDIKPAIVIGNPIRSLGHSYLSHLLDKVFISSALFGELIHSLVIADPKSDIPSFPIFPSIITHD